MAKRPSPSIAQRIGSLYQTTALLLLNTFILLIVLEGGARLALPLVNAAPDQAEEIAAFKDKMLAQTYYAGQEWARDYWDEHMMAVDHWTYAPYQLWRTDPFDGQQIRVDAQGRRVTPGADCDEADYRIFMFGGSTMWGYGAPDWGTIPAYLQQQIGSEACVVNYGEIAYNSTQARLQLMALLQAGDVPDIVVFYDGSNDIAAAQRTGQAGAHFYEPLIRRSLASEQILYGEGADPLGRLLSQTAIYRLLASPAADQEPNWAQPPFEPAFVDGITARYLDNVRAVSALANEYDFTFVAFVQPILAAGDRQISDEQQRFLWEMPSGLPELFAAVYPRWKAAAAERDELIYLGDGLADESLPVWIDFNHLTPWGNLSVAASIYRQLEDRLP